MGIVLKMYANESKGEKFPPKTPYVYTFIFDPYEVYPEYLTDIKVLICPSDAEGPKLLGPGGDWVDVAGNLDLSKIAGEGEVPGGTTEYGDASYIYLGWAIPDNEYITPPAFLLGEYILLDPAAGDYDDDITIDGHPTLGDGVVFYRLREGIERFFISDINNPAASNMAQSELAVMWDVVMTRVVDFSHVPGGCNVLYMDGHVEFVRYPGEFPVSPEWAQISDLGAGPP